MKGKKFYLILVGLVLVGIGSLFVYKQQQEARVLEFEGYEIASIESRVEALYNEDKTDIQENISNELMNLEQVFSELSEKDLSYRNEHRIEELRGNFLKAKTMYELQEEILNLFEKKNIVRKNNSKQVIKELETSLNAFKENEEYFKRNSNYLTDVKIQVETMEEAIKFVASLTKDGIPREDLELEDLEKAEELIEQLKDKDLQETLSEQIKEIRFVLSGLEEEIVLEETEVTDEELEEDLDEIEIEKSVKEVVEEDNINLVQENNQRTNQTKSSTIPNNQRANSPRQPVQNNNQSNSSQKQTSPNYPANSSQPNTNTNNQTNNQTSNQPKEPADTNENKSDSNRNSVAEKYRETVVVEEYSYSSRERIDSNVAPGTILETGRTGNKTVVYEVTIYNNGTSSRKFISEDITLPKDEVIAVGGAVSEPGADDE